MLSKLSQSGERRLSKIQIHQHYSTSISSTEPAWKVCFRLARVLLKFLGLSQHGLKGLSIECLIFWTMSGPYLDHVKAMFSRSISILTKVSSFCKADSVESEAHKYGESTL